MAATDMGASLPPTETPGDGVLDLVPEPPAWVPAWVGPDVRRVVAVVAPELGSLIVARGEAFSHLSVNVPDASDLDGPKFERAVTAAFAVFADELASQRRHPIRFWSFIPGIHDLMGSGADRYMAFNSGRYRAFEKWFKAVTYPQALPASSGVGVQGKTLFVHCLAADSAGDPLENPRQHPAYQYSSRYGIRPPCFARATLVRAPGLADQLIVSGTASILGEDTAHKDNIVRQSDETLLNLATLVRSACERATVAGDEPAEWRWLDRFRSLRIHVVRRTDAARVVEATTRHVPNLEHLELVQAELCRPDLLVEIEGVASLDR